ncbi:hypothetical protein AVL62_12585 [Serinicoccus chungangensis]|uniref:ABC transmembrane type-1 domain-containing protein n=1 Tax=Serinicoccus chungangensis TaxID=767452 RepID=A0A0W8I0T4_9MICO|nr:sugar ABC transporter permease [Serinicoccus chungangensis]KUG51083.1 hypothetical protein AVL62_12585 [Serinicoccus chungangensis]
MTARAREHLTSYAMLLPALVLFGVFLFAPLVSAVVTSFPSDSGVGAAEWVGLGNYRRMLDDDAFWRASFNTVLLAVVSVPLALGLGLGIAMLLQGRSVGARCSAPSSSRRSSSRASSWPWPGGSSSTRTSAS